MKIVFKNSLPYLYILRVLLGNQECIIKMESVREWMVHVQNEVNKMEDVSKESELKEKRCIYNIPNYIREQEKKAYTPQLVTFGPYHHNYYPFLQELELEEPKRRAILHFLKRSGKKLTEYCKALLKEVKNLKEAFEHPESLGDDGDFVRMMILDGCFILEILRTAGGYAPAAGGYAPDVSYLTKMPSISRDMLLLENQVPLRVLQILVHVERQHAEDKHVEIIQHAEDKHVEIIQHAEDKHVEILVDVEDMGDDKQVVINYILRFFGLSRQSQSMDKQGSLHVLDVFRRGLLVEPPKKPKPLESGCEIDIIPSATELLEAGIRFLTSKTTSLMDITFNGSTLRCPPIVLVTDDTKSFFLNLMAFERMHVGAGNEVTSYVYFMGCLIKSDRDASLLRSVGIVPGALGSDEDVAQLFRSISKYALLNPNYSALVRDFQSVTKKLRNRVRMKLSAWRMDLLKKYLKSPSGVVSVTAAIIIFFFTTIQTAIAVLSYNN